MIKYAAETAVPPVTPRYRPVRRVRLFSFFVAHEPDPDNLTKFFLDGCKLAKLIVDDKSRWLDWERPRVSKSQDKTPRTVVTIEDVDRDETDYWRLCYDYTDAQLFAALAPAEHPHPRCKCRECTLKWRPDELKPVIEFRTRRS